MADTKEIITGEEKKSLSFVEQFVEEDLAEGKNGGRIQTRFPPEPNGYLHIGHAKAICMDFGVAEKYNGVCNLRFDDTNPTKENTEYVENILNDIKWLGFKWGNIYYASDYFDKLWDFAKWLIIKGRAYIDEQTSEQIAAQKGTPTTPGTPSPYRERPVEENMRLFEKMNTPEAEEGSMVLRAKLDMANPNMHFRDPIIYRIIHTSHHRTGTKWHAYPMYDFAHGQSDYFEGVTHSICTLEFVPHRPLYDLFVDYLCEKDGQNSYRPRQIEFNRLNLTYTMMSKRKLLALVEEGKVNGWDDPRMPTISGMRRRGYSPESIRNFIDSIGYVIKGICETNILYDSLPKGKKRGGLYSTIDGLAVSRYYIVDAITSLIAGFAFVINPYLPIILCLIANIISTILSTRFRHTQMPDDEKEKKIGAREYFKQLKSAIKFAKKSKRMKCLLIFFGLTSGLLYNMTTFRSGVLEQIQLPEQYFGIVFAISQIAASMCSRAQGLIHKKFRNTI